MFFLNVTAAVRLQCLQFRLLLVGNGVRLRRSHNSVTSFFHVCGETHVLYVRRYLISCEVAAAVGDFGFFIFQAHSHVHYTEFFAQNTCEGTFGRLNITRELTSNICLIIMSIISRSGIFTGNIVDTRRAGHSVHVYFAGADGRYRQGGILRAVCHVVDRQSRGEPHVLDRFRQFLRRRLLRPVLDVSGIFLQEDLDANDVGPLADRSLDVSHATLAGHTLNADPHRADLLSHFRRTRHAHQMRRAFVVGVIIAVPIKNKNKKIVRM